MKKLSAIKFSPVYFREFTNYFCVPSLVHPDSSQLIYSEGDLKQYKKAFLALYNDVYMHFDAYRGFTPVYSCKLKKRRINGTNDKYKSLVSANNFE